MTNETRSGSAPTSVMRLLHALVNGTDADKVEWKQVGHNEYRFDGGKGHVTINTEPDEEAPFIFTIYDVDDAALEVYEGPTRFSDGTLDVALMGLWRAVIQQKRGRTIDPVIDSLIEAAGGDTSRRDDGPDDTDLDDLPF